MDRSLFCLKYFKNIGIGSLIALILSMILLLGFSVILVNTNLTENTTSPVVIILSSGCILISSMFSSKKNGKNGMLSGALVGGIYLLVLWMISTILLENLSFSMQTGIMLLTSILTGMFRWNIGCKY